MNVMNVINNISCTSVNSWGGITNFCHVTASLEVFFKVESGFSLSLINRGHTTKNISTPPKNSDVHGYSIYPPLSKGSRQYIRYNCV